MIFRRVASQTVFQGRVFKVRKDRLQSPNGHEFDIDLVEHAGAVTIIPVDDAGQVWLVRQYRHPAGKELLEFPAGVMDPNEPPETSARRELREEIGMAPVSLTSLGEFFLAPGYSTEYMYVFLARGLLPAPLQPDEDEFIKIEKAPKGELAGLIRSGQIQDAKTLAAIYLWQSGGGDQSEG